RRDDRKSLRLPSSLTVTVLALDGRCLSSLPSDGATGRAGGPSEISALHRIRHGPDQKTALSSLPPHRAKNPSTDRSTAAVFRRAVTRFSPSPHFYGHRLDDSDRPRRHRARPQEIPAGCSGAPVENTCPHKMVPGQVSETSSGATHRPAPEHPVPTFGRYRPGPGALPDRPSH